MLRRVSQCPSTLVGDVFVHLYPAGVPSDAVDLPDISLPQQATEPSTLTPQVLLSSALTEANSPSGGVAWP